MHRRKLGERWVRTALIPCMVPLLVGPVAGAQADPGVEVIVAAVRLASGYLDRSTVVVDTSTLGLIGVFDGARLVALRGRLDPRVQLGVPSVEDVCAAAPRPMPCVRFMVRTYEIEEAQATITVTWTNALAGRCSSSTTIRAKFSWGGSRMADPWIYWREFSDCGSAPDGLTEADTLALELAAARRLRSDYSRGRPGFQDLGGSFGDGTATPLHRPPTVLMAILGALNADLVETPRGDPCLAEEGPDCTPVTLRLGRPHIAGDSATVMAYELHWHSERLGGFAEYAMHFVRTPEGWQFVRLGQGRQGTLLRRP